MKMKALYGIPAVIVCLCMLMLTIGCPESPTEPQPPPNKKLGPPWGTITFLDNDLALGTVDPDDDSLEQYFMSSTGQSRLIADPGYIAKWIHNSNPEIAKFLLYDDTPNHRDLFVLDMGEREFIADSVIHLAYDKSPAGTRVTYVRETFQGSQRLFFTSIGIAEELDTVLTIDPPERIRGEPQLDFIANTPVVVVNIENVDYPHHSYFRRVKRDGNNMHLVQQDMNVAAVKMNRDTGLDKWAYIPIPVGGTALNANTIVLTEMSEIGGELEEGVDYDFSPHSGAMNLKWASDGHKVALYVGLGTGNPRLAIAQDGEWEGIINIIELPKPLALPTGDDLWFAYPDWSPDNDRVCVLLYNEEANTNEVAVVNVGSGEVKIIVEGIDPDIIFQPTWRQIETD